MIAAWTRITRRARALQLAYRFVADDALRGHLLACVRAVDARAELLATAARCPLCGGEGVLGELDRQEVAPNA